MDTELVWSRDAGRSWHRAANRPAFLTQSPSLRWDDTWVNLPSSGPIRFNNRLYFHYSGRSGGHHSSYPSNLAAIGLATLRIDGFASLCAGVTEATILTKPMRWPGGDAELHINADPRRDLLSHPGDATGEIRVEVRDASSSSPSTAIEGMMWDQCIPVGQTRDLEPDGSAQIVWRGGRTMRALAGKHVRLAFRLRDAHLFSFRARTSF